jgi:broad specificity phosphatase PhoE
VTTSYIVQHGEKAPHPGDPGLTELGRWQAARTAEWLRTAGLVAVYASPLRRAVETAEAIASAYAITVELDPRLRERMNWEGGEPWAEFTAEWEKSAADRDYVPRSGDSSRRAGERLRDFLLEHQPVSGSVALVSHGGVTVDLLRSLLGDDRVPGGLLRDGVPGCAITTFDGLTVTEIASVAHLA